MFYVSQQEGQGERETLGKEGAEPQAGSPSTECESSSLDHTDSFGEMNGQTGFIDPPILLTHAHSHGHSSITQPLSTHLH